MTATIDEVAKTLGEFEALAQKTGEWDGADAVEFSADGVTWLPVWVPTTLLDEPGRFPAFARATVHRKGVAAPTVMIVAWDESLPAAEEWRALWERKPMKLFGSFALRSAIRHAFRDVVGDLTGPDEDRTGPTVGAPPADRTDWDTQLADAPDVAALDLVWKDMRTDRARTPSREVAYNMRRVELAAAAWEPAAVEIAPRRSGRATRMQEFLAEQGTAEPTATDVAPAEGPKRPAPMDYLPPANRAERRAAAKRKGRSR
jgi:hypothetical protein